MTKGERMQKAFKKREEEQMALQKRMGRLGSYYPFIGESITYTTKSLVEKLETLSEKAWYKLNVSDYVYTRNVNLNSLSKCVTKVTDLVKACNTYNYPKSYIQFLASCEYAKTLLPYTKLSKSDIDSILEFISSAFQPCDEIFEAIKTTLYVIHRDTIFPIKSEYLTTFKLPRLMINNKNDYHTYFNGNVKLAEPVDINKAILNNIILLLNIPLKITDFKSDAVINSKLFKNIMLNICTLKRYNINMETYNTPLLQLPQSEFVEFMKTPYINIKSDKIGLMSDFDAYIPLMKSGTNPQILQAFMSNFDDKNTISLKLLLKQIKTLNGSQISELVNSKAVNNPVCLGEAHLEAFRLFTRTQDKNIFDDLIYELQNIELQQHERINLRDFCVPISKCFNSKTLTRAIKISYQLNDNLPYFSETVATNLLGKSYTCNSYVIDRKEVLLLSFYLICEPLRQKLNYLDTIGANKLNLTMLETMIKEIDTSTLKNTINFVVFKELLNAFYTKYNNLRTI